MSGSGSWSLALSISCPVFRRWCPSDIYNRYCSWRTISLLDELYCSLCIYIHHSSCYRRGVLGFSIFWFNLSMGCGSRW
ncbi:hypothetical protein VN97_g3542 [Penicillium thymicola]|uniref:Uncharacterized protein n=1 Tax=Penicillium thymicola TaxID=293382 RepID=A0AAI9XAQ7_PENTH|nr:hypothetical protein VN97_g3542 [Penicillium thymicola]